MFDMGNCFGAPKKKYERVLLTDVTDVVFQSGPFAQLPDDELLLQPAKPNLMVPLMKYRGHDQGIHNYLLRTGALPNARLIPNGQHVYTVAYVNDADIALGPAGTILAPGPHLCPIVHQYNYKPALLAHVRSAYPSVA
jgi:hypothetical protein